MLINSAIDPRLTSVSPSVTTDTSKMEISSTSKIQMMTSLKNTIDDDDTAVGGSKTRETPSTGSTTTAVPTSSKAISKNTGSLSGGVIGVGVAVGVAVVVLIAGVLILISVTVCLRQRKKKELLITASNVAYHSASGQLSMTKDTSAEEYDYVSTHSPHPDHTPNITGGGVVISSNEAYGVTLREDMTENDAYGVCQNEVELGGNVAYGVCQNEVELGGNVAYGVGQNEVELGGNVAYGVGQNEVELGGNVAYGVGQNEVEVKDNEAYTTTATGGGAGMGEDGNKYDYVTRMDVIVNETYEMSRDVSVSTNEAWGCL